jgi:hypothetical protein
MDPFDQSHLLLCFVEPFAIEFRAFLSYVGLDPSAIEFDGTKLRLPTHHLDFDPSVVEAGDGLEGGLAGGRDVELEVELVTD